MEEFPSDAGGFQCNVTESFVISTASGVPGFEGGSKMNMEDFIWNAFGKNFKSPPQHYSYSVYTYVE